MTTLVVILFLSKIFGGTMEARMTFESAADCQQFKRVLVKFTVKHTIVQDCKS